MPLPGRVHGAALLTSVIDDATKISLYIADCMRLGIRTLPPDVNRSGQSLHAGEGRAIRFGLLAIKNLGKGFIAAILEEREKKRRIYELL